MSTSNATVFNTVVSTVVGTASPGGGSLSAARFTFNGVDQYAVMDTAYAANGRPREYEFNFNAEALATSTEQVILSGTDGTDQLEFVLWHNQPNLVVRHKHSGGTTAEVVNTPVIIAGEDTKVEVRAIGLPDPVILINGVEADISAFVPSSGVQPPITHIGAGHEVGRYFGGQIWGLDFTDASPIQDTSAVFGNSSRYGSLNNPIDLSTGDIEITWDGVYGTGIDWVLSDGASSNPSGIRVSSNIQLFSGVTTGIAHSHGMSVGQHYAGSVRFVGGDYFIDIDGVEIGTGTMLHLAWDAISELTGNSGISQFMDATEAFQNISITAPASGIGVLWPLNEGSDNDIVARTLDGVGTEPLRDGVWTGGAVWAAIDPNSRKYPMNEGEGDTFHCYRPDGSDYDAGDATITNPDAEGGGWPAEIPASPTNLIIRVVHI